MADNDKITFKEFLRATPQFAELFFWGFTGCMAICGIVFLVSCVFALILMTLFPESSIVAFMNFIKWAEANTITLVVLSVAAFLIGLFVLIRKVVIEYAKTVQRGGNSEV